MTYLFVSIPLLYSIALIAVPAFFYRQPERLPMKFLSGMVLCPAMRKVYAMALTILILLLSFSFYKANGVSLYLLPCFLYGFMLLRFRLADAMLCWLQRDRMLQGLMFGAILLTMMEPQLLSFSLSLAMTQLAAMFYPSRKVLRMADNPTLYQGEVGIHKLIRENYF